MKSQRAWSSACSIAIASLGIAGSASAQCLEWSDRFTTRGPDAFVSALAAFDDGSGTKLYAGGGFTAVGSVDAKRIARFDGSDWSPLGTDALDNFVDALVVFDDGTGPALYAGGLFTVAGSTTLNRVGKWDGAAWSPLGLGVGGFRVYALAVFDDGSGSALYAGGDFTTAGGMSASNIARWSGSSWSTVGSGINGEVDALTVFDDGTGPALYAGGKFTNAGGAGANNVAKWNGTTWSALGSGTASANAYSGQVRALASFGGELYAAGHFETAGGAPAVRIARWNGTTWSNLAQGLTTVWGAIYASGNALFVFDDGSGAALYVGGHFTKAGNQNTKSLARWNGTSWSGLGQEITQEGGSVGVHTARALAAFDDGAHRLYAGGTFTLTAPGAHAHNLARWDGANWSVTATGQGMKDRTDKEIFNVDAFESFDHDGDGETSLFAGGNFAQAGASYAYGVARWDGAQWTGMPPPATFELTSVFALLGDADGFGAGPTLYAGGYGYTCGGILQYRNGAWSSLDSGLMYALGRLDPEVHALAMFDDGSGRALYVGGEFDEEGCFSAPNSLFNIAKWNGSSWSAVGGGTNNRVLALVVFDDGSGAALYAGGSFTQAGGVPANHVARWNGTSWSALGSGTSAVQSLCVFDDGSGARLYAAAGSSVSKWNGSTWTVVGGAMNQVVDTLSVFDDGSGAALYAGGAFTSAGGSSANYVAKWNGSTWTALGSGTDNRVLALASHDDGIGGGPDLYVGGWFRRAGGKSSQNVGEWHGCQHDGVSYCAGDDVDPLVTTDCPCGNFGEPNHGCGNFPFTNGARMTASGTTSPNTILFTCNDLPNNTLCTFLRGNNNVPAGFVFGDGVRCVQVPLLRFGQQNSGQGGNPPSTAVTATVTELPGVTRYYQCQYRNPVGGWCDPGLFNVSNGYRLSW